MYGLLSGQIICNLQRDGVLRCLRITICSLFSTILLISVFQELNAYLTERGIIVSAMDRDLKGHNRVVLDNMLTEDEAKALIQLAEVSGLAIFSMLWGHQM